MQNSFVPLAGDRNDRFVLCVATVKLLFSLNTQTDSCKTTIVYLEYMECTPVVHKIDTNKTAYLRWSTADEEDHNTVSEAELSKRTELNVGRWFEVKYFSAIRVVVRVVRGKYRIILLRGLL